MRVIRQVLELDSPEQGEDKKARSPAAPVAQKRFALPMNMSISIMQTMTNLLTNPRIVSTSKDFLILQLVEVLQLLLRMHPMLV